MRHQVILVSDGHAEVLASFDADSTVELLRTKLAEIKPSSPFITPTSTHGNSKRVYVVSVEEDTGLSYQRGDQFESALAASRALGFKDNVVGTRLAAARRTKGEDEITVKGVTLRYVDSIRV